MMSSSGLVMAAPSKLRPDLEARSAPRRHVGHGIAGLKPDRSPRRFPSRTATLTFKAASRRVPHVLNFGQQQVDAFRSQVELPQLQLWHRAGPAWLRRGRYNKSPCACEPGPGMVQRARDPGTGGLFLGCEELFRVAASASPLRSLIEHRDCPMVKDGRISRNEQAALGQQTVLEGGYRLGSGPQHDRH